MNIIMVKMLKYVYGTIGDNFLTRVLLPAVKFYESNNYSINHSLTNNLYLYALLKNLQ